MLAAYYQPIVYGDPNSLHYLVGKFWNVNEKVTTGYIRGNMNFELSPSVTLKGNLGLQVVNTDQSSDSQFLNTGSNTIQPFTEGRKYTDVLPALNFAFVLPGDQAVRIGLARELARARMDQLKASSEIGCGAGTGVCGGDRGNPLLSPWRADAYDLSYEKYFGTKGGYISVAGFLKRLKSYIYPLSDGTHDFSDFIATLPPGYFNPGVVVNPIGSLTQPVNGSGGSVMGLELVGVSAGRAVLRLAERLRNDPQHFADFQRHQDHRYAGHGHNLRHGLRRRSRCRVVEDRVERDALL